jgi:hypothetical protein
MDFPVKPVWKLLPRKHGVPLPSRNANRNAAFMPQNQRAIRNRSCAPKASRNAAFLPELPI